MSRTTLIRCGSFCLALVAAALPAFAHEDHDHEAPAAGIETAAPRAVATMTSELYEAVAEPHGDHIAVYLDRFETNEPVLGAQVSISIGDGPGVDAEEEEPGVYEVPATGLVPGAALTLTLMISGADGDDLLGGTLQLPEASVDDHGHWYENAWVWLLTIVAVATAGWLATRRSRTAATGMATLAAILLIAAPAADAHEDHDHGAEEMSAPASGNRPARLADGSVFVPKATQRILAIRTRKTELKPASVAIKLVGELQGDPRSSAEVQTLQGGRVAAAGKDWPVLGARVSRGSPLLRVTPTASGTERSSAGAELARVAAELTQARLELDRLAGLAGVVSRSEIESARSRVVSLEAQRLAYATPGGQAEVLRAPVSGVIAMIGPRPGQVVAPGEALLTIIDPSQWSVEALAFEPINPATIQSASVTLRNGQSLPAKLQGVGSQLAGGAAAVQLRLLEAAPGLAAGQPATVYLQSTATTDSIALPREALVRLASGEAVVFEKIDAERFAARTVRWRAIAGDQIAVLAGIDADSRVVVSGAALLAQIR